MPSISTSRYLADAPVEADRIDAWVEQFHRDGYLFLTDVLPPPVTAQLRDDLDEALATDPPRPEGRIQLHHRMFESSRANLRLFDLEPIVTFAERLIDQVCHVIHNNSFWLCAGVRVLGDNDLRQA